MWWGKDHIVKGGGYKDFITFIRNNTESKYMTSQIITDHLRKIGVLVPFRHFTPEMLIAEGVVKLKTL